MPGSFINNDEPWKKIAKGALSVFPGFVFATISLIYTPFERLFDKIIPEEREEKSKKDELIGLKNETRIKLIQK